MARTLFDKLWSSHLVATQEDGADLIAIDRVLVHERTGGVALKSLLNAGRRPVAADRVFAIMDHIVSFRAGRGRDEARSPGGEVFITETRAMAKEAGVHLIDTDDSRQGIVHVVAPELAIAQPGVSIVCPDSHTCSLGALGALAVGVGSSDAEHAIATGVMRMKKPPQMRVLVDGQLPSGVSAKDLALHIISNHGAAGGARAAIEFTGPAIAALDVESRLTLCNLAVEFAAFTSVIAPDERTIEFVSGRQFSPSADHLDAATRQWRDLASDDGTSFDFEIRINADEVREMVTWGTSPEEAVPVGSQVPEFQFFSENKKAQAKQAFDYMGVSAGTPLANLQIDGAFIGSCTNGRLSDLRAAAEVLRGQRVANTVRAVCVPGSGAVRSAAEEEGIDQVFKAAGFEWGSPGCAMCFYAGGETFPPEARVISSTNRNFQGRQGPGVRTHLASPRTVAASAIAGRIVSAGVIAQRAVS